MAIKFFNDEIKAQSYKKINRLHLQALIIKDDQLEFSLDIIQRNLQNFWISFKNPSALSNFDFVVLAQNKIALRFIFYQKKHCSTIFICKNYQMDTIKGSQRVSGFDQPSVWSIMNPLAIKTKSINLGQGFPAWSPPDFYLNNLELSLKDGHHQYTRGFGSMNLVEAIADFHKKQFPGLNPETNILTTSGGVEALFCSILGFTNQGDEVIFFDPSYDCYRGQIQIAGAVSIGIPLKAKIQQTKAMIRQRCPQTFVASSDDDWIIDFELFEKSLNERTKVFIFNSPQNPVGRVFSEEEIKQLCEILRKFPNIVVVEDNVYIGMTFDDYLGKDLPKIAHQPGFQKRTLSLYSAGKIFAATGVRSGWIIGHEDLIKSVRPIHQFNMFCSYNIIQNTIAKSLAEISRPESTYLKDCALRLTKNRNMLIEELLASKYDFDLWIPKGGYFIVADIQKIQVSEKYLYDENGNKRSKDYAFCFEMAHENGVVAIPCSAFYSKKDVHLGERYIRFAFCKHEEMIRDAGKKLR